jgi:HlyD family secretion protein
MDIPRYGIARNKKLRALAVLFALAFLVIATAYGISSLEPAARSVDGATLWRDRVQRGTMLRDVHGVGSLVPEDSLWISTSRDGVVEKIHVRIGDTVGPSTILAELRSEDLLQSLLDAELQIRAAEADLASMNAAHERDAISQTTQLASMEVSVERARLRGQTDQELGESGLKSMLDVRLSKMEADSLVMQLEQERKRVEALNVAAQTQVLAQKTRIALHQSTYEMRKRQVDQLKIRADASGVLQELSLQLGQRVSSGMTIAKIADPGRLKAQIRIPETQAKDLLVGQSASIDTHSAVVPGRVIHIDPAAVQGTVTVDVQLDGPLPSGARPNLGVDGSVEIERLSDVLFVGRSANSQAHSSTQIFKVLPTGEAIRVAVKVGRISVNSVEVVEGLEEGDEVILSDMSTWDAYNRLRLR